MLIPFIQFEIDPSIFTPMGPAELPDGFVVDSPAKEPSRTKQHPLHEQPLLPGEENSGFFLFSF